MVPIRNIDDVMEEIGQGPWILQLISILCVGSMADAMQLNLLSFTSPCAGTEFGLSASSTSFISGIVFIGSLVGAQSLGALADRRGRKFAYGFSLATMVIFGVSTYFTSTFRELLLCQFCVGFGIGGCVAPFDYISEAVPARARGVCCMASMLCYGAGSLLTVATAWATLDAYGWRSLALGISCPIFLAFLGVFTIPESARWLLSVGRTDDAIAALKIAAARNGKHLDPFQLAVPKTNSRHVSASSTMHRKNPAAESQSMFSKKYLPCTIILFINWFSFGLCYFGAVSLISEIFMVTPGGGGQEEGCAFDYPSILLAAASEPALMAVGLAVIDRSRRWTQGGSYLLAGVFLLALGAAPPNAGRGRLVPLALAARGCVNMGSNATWTATPEAYPTSQRARAHGFLYIASRLGAFCSPYLVYSELSRSAKCLVLSVSCFLPGLCSFLLKETAGKHLDGEEEEDGRKEEEQQRRASGAAPPMPLPGKQRGTYVALATENEENEGKKVLPSSFLEGGGENYDLREGDSNNI